MSTLIAVILVCVIIAALYFYGKRKTGGTGSGPAPPPNNTCVPPMPSRVHLRVWGVQPAGDPPGIVAAINKMQVEQGAVKLLVASLADTTLFNGTGCVDYPYKVKPTTTALTAAFDKVHTAILSDLLTVWKDGGSTVVATTNALGPILAKLSAIGAPSVDVWILCPTLWGAYDARIVAATSAVHMMASDASNLAAECAKTPYPS